MGIISDLSKSYKFAIASCQYCSLARREISKTLALKMWGLFLLAPEFRMFPRLGPKP